MKKRSRASYATVTLSGSQHKLPRSDAHGRKPGRCDTGATLIDVPTRRRRHAITETPPVQAALDELRQALGDDRVEMGELVILGAREKLARVRADRDDAAALRRRLADRIRRREIPADRVAADEVRRAGWARS